MDKTAIAPLRVLQVNSLLTGGGTDDQCLKLTAGLHRLGQWVWLAGPARSELEPVIERADLGFRDTGPKGGKLGFVLRVARWIRWERVEIVHGHHGRDIWPVILAARLAGTRPKIVLTRHCQKPRFVGQPAVFAGAVRCLDRGIGVCGQGFARGRL